jgi:hypothetical protein
MVLEYAFYYYIYIKRSLVKKQKIMPVMFIKLYLAAGKTPMSCSNGLSGALKSNWTSKESIFTKSEAIGA